MASAKVAVVVVAILALLQVSCAVARRHGKPSPSDAEADAAVFDMPGGTRHEKPAASRDGGSGGISAVMTVNGFQRGGSGGGAAACDGHFHSDRDMIVALSTGWFEHGRRCHRTIRITSRRNGRTVEARVVDECDSRRGCRNNIVDSSPAVWRALGLDTNVGEVPVTWSDA